MNERWLRELNGNIRQIQQSSGTTTAVRFTCPKCPEEYRHSITVSWAGPSLFRSGAVWKLESAPDIDVLTLSPSINCDVQPTYPDDWDAEDRAEDERTRCKFHGFVQNGMVRW
jgi:hypothetical protein